jgi:hypothetical protein
MYKKRNTQIKVIEDVLSHTTDIAADFCLPIDALSGHSDLFDFDTKKLQLQTADSSTELSFLSAIGLMRLWRKSMGEGVLWRDLLMTVEAEEILLMDAMDVRKRYGDARLEIFVMEFYHDYFDYRNHNHFDEDFELLEGRGLRTLIRKLHGLLVMMEELKRLSLVSPRRPLLAEKIYRKIRTAFEEPLGSAAEEPNIRAGETGHPSHPQDAPGEGGPRSDAYVHTIEEDDCRYFQTGEHSALYVSESTSHGGMILDWRIPMIPKMFYF